MEENIVEKTKLSLYLDSGLSKEIESIRALCLLDGRNLKAIPEFTSIIEGMTWFTYETLKSDKAPLVFRGFFADVKPGPESASGFINIESTLAYPKPEGYEAKNVILKSEQKEVIERVIKLLNEKGPTPLDVDYSTFIKKIAEIITSNKYLKVKFFTDVFIGNLYNLEPSTSVKVFESPDHQDLSVSEMKQVKYIASDFIFINELNRIRKNLPDSWKDQTNDLIASLRERRNQLWSLIGNFNYADAFFGFLYGETYLYGNYKSLVSFIQDIDFNPEGLKHQLGQNYNERVITVHTQRSNKKIKERISLYVLQFEDFINRVSQLLGLGQISNQLGIHLGQDMDAIMKDIQKDAEDKLKNRM
jgi:hypothetical protein